MTPAPDHIARAEQQGWEMVGHVCRHCLYGRVARRDRTYRCCTCGVQTQDSPRGICGCGIRPTIARAGGFRCVANPERGPASPGEFVILFDGQASQ